jgi:hypothetical protein
MAPVRSLRVQRSLTAILLCAWAVPGAVGLLVALHLELHHGPHHRPADGALGSEPAAERGHSHELSEPAHDHPAVRSPGPEALHERATAWALTGLTPPEPVEAFAEPAPAPPLRPPPRPLFTLHCALLS